MALKRTSDITRSPKLDISDSAKKSHCPWGRQDLLSNKFKQFITLYLKKQKEDICSGGAARQVACELKNLIQV